MAIYSDRDEVVVPHRSARLEHPDLSVTRLQVHGVGHLSLLVNSAVAHAIATALTGEAGSRQCPSGQSDSAVARPPGWIVALPKSMRYGSASRPLNNKSGC